MMAEDDNFAEWAHFSQLCHVGKAFALPDLLACVIDIDSVLSSKTTAHFHQSHIVTTHESDPPHGPPWYAMRAKLVRKHGDYSNNLRHFILCKKWREMRRLCSCLPREWPQTMFIVLGGFQGERAGNDGSWSPGVVCGKQGGCRDVKREGLGWEKRRETHKIMTWHVGRKKGRRLNLEENG